MKYKHLQNDSITVEKSDKVEEGEVIASNGSTGRSTGTHLHFQVEVYNIETKEIIEILQG